MKTIDNIDLEKIEYSIIRTNKKVEYINCSVGFDIETTSTYIENDKVAYMYMYTMGIDNGGNIWHGRTWEQFIKDCKLLSEHFKLNEQRRLIIYVHNLGFEFQFFRKYFDWVDVFSVSERKPLKALTSLGIEFRDSYLLSGYSLENTAKNLHSKTVKKLVGDLDYSLKRNEKTPLTEKELQYCINDVEIILQYINEQIQIYGDITKIPLTNTGRVRKLVRHNCYYTNTNHRKSSGKKYQKYKNLMDSLILDVDLYQMLKRAFMGGYTHANANYTGQVLKEVTSIDFTSSYPSVMLSEMYPMSKAIDIEFTTEKDFNFYKDRYCLLFDIKFTNIQSKIMTENYLSESKCNTLENPIINNGRVYSADSLTTTITDVDYEIIEKVYSWDRVQVANVKGFYKGYLPKDIIKSIVDLYQKKTELKGVEGSEVEYMLSKGMLNSIYGMTVTDIVRNEVSYTTDWGVEPANPEEQIEKYNTSRSRFLYYPWGVWITAYARRNLWSGILAMGDDYIYSDTDSIKLMNYDKHKPYIEHYNNQLIEKLQIMCNELKVDFSLLEPKTIKGVKKMIGVWDFDGHYKQFKTLGAKRYLTLDDNGHYNLTCSGLSKSNGIEFLIKQAKETGSDVMDLFNNEMYIPPEWTSKSTHTYIDCSYSFDDVDYLGNTVHIETLSGIHLEKTDYTLSISKQYIKFLNNLLNGYLFTGVEFL